MKWGRFAPHCKCPKTPPLQSGRCSQTPSQTPPLNEGGISSQNPPTVKGDRLKARLKIHSYPHIPSSSAALFTPSSLFSRTQRSFEQGSVLGSRRQRPLFVDTENGQTVNDIPLLSCSERLNSLPYAEEAFKLTAERPGLNPFAFSTSRTPRLYGCILPNPSSHVVHSPLYPIWECFSIMPTSTPENNIVLARPAVCSQAKNAIRRTN